ncbi:unnamed protein product [Closterium sp. Naga37s-1]|nr:unnamed protein product [Closterium sp. Naga37s-1]
MDVLLCAVPSAPSSSLLSHPLLAPTPLPAKLSAFVELQGRLVETDSKLKQVSVGAGCAGQVAEAGGMECSSEGGGIWNWLSLMSLPRRNVVAFGQCMQAPALHTPRHLACHSDRHLDIASLSSSQQHIRMLPLADPMTRFVLQPLEEARATEEGKIKEAEATIASLQGSKKYLEKQMREVQSNFKELMEQLPASIPGLTQAING